LQEREVKTAEWFLRIALAVTMLSAVGDRFGLWGPLGTPNVSWGDWAHFVGYCAKVNSFLPMSWAPALSWMATVLEILCGVGLIVGWHLRLFAYSTAALLLSFAVAMTISFGIKSPLNFSVFADVAGALLLALVVGAREGNNFRQQSRWWA
jgi:putative oxidoreductase